MNRKFLLIPLGVSIAFFFEAVLSDLYYSNCVSVGSPQVSCTNNAYGLKDFVLFGNQWILQPLNSVLSIFVHGSGYIPISDTMGIVAGLGFIGSGMSFLAYRFRGSISNALADSMILLALLYVVTTYLFLRFLPFCIEYPCRVTNYLPFLYYFEVFEIAIVALGVGFAIRMINYSRLRVK